MYYRDTFWGGQRPRAINHEAQKQRLQNEKSEYFLCFQHKESCLFLIQGFKHVGPSYRVELLITRPIVVWDRTIVRTHKGQIIRGARKNPFIFIKKTKNVPEDNLTTTGILWYIKSWELYEFTMSTECFICWSIVPYQRRNYLTCRPRSAARAQKPMNEKIVCRVDT